MQNKAQVTSKISSEVLRRLKSCSRRTCVECQQRKPVGHFDMYGRRLPVCRDCRRSLDWGIRPSHFIRRLKVYLWMTRKDPIYYRKRG